MDTANFYLWLEQHMNSCENSNKIFSILIRSNFDCPLLHGCRKVHEWRFIRYLNKSFRCCDEN